MLRRTSIGMTGTIGFDDQPECFRRDITFDPSDNLATFTIQTGDDAAGGALVCRFTDEGYATVEGIAKSVRTMIARPDAREMSRGLGWVRLALPLGRDERSSAAVGAVEGEREAIWVERDHLATQL